MTRANGRTPDGRRYSRNFPGDDAQDKRVARMFIYKHAATAPIVGHAIALAGTNACAEVGLMRDYLTWPGTRVHFVDWAKSLQVTRALNAIKRDWPEANVWRRDINDVVESLPIIGFAALDFMGFNHTSVIPCVQKTIGRMPRGGVMALTSFRGREWVMPHRAAWDVYKAARDVVGPDAKRLVGKQRLVEQWAKEQHVTLEWVDGLDYQHKNSPMSVMIWRRAWR